MAVGVSFTRDDSVANLIEHLIAGATSSLDVALYRLNNPQLAGAVADAARRGVTTRMVLDRAKFNDDPQTRHLLKNGAIPFRLLGGREDTTSKMHHKFAILDGRTALTGSYNWTLDSEKKNYENLVVIHDLNPLEAYRQEFEKLWKEAERSGD